MSWILIAYLLALIFLASKLEDATRKRAFRSAWITFSLIPIWNFFMHLFRAGSIQNTMDLHLIEVWDQAIPSLLLGISFLFLLGVLAPKHPTSENENH